MRVKPKLLFLIPSLEAGGAQKVLSILLNYVSKEIFDITLCVLTETGVFYDAVPDSVKKVNLRISRVRYSGPKIYRFIKATAPDVVFVFDVNNLSLIVGLLSFILPRRIKYITREVVVLSEFIKTYSFLKTTRRRLYSLIFRRFHVIVAQSNYMRYDLVNEFSVPKSKTVVINNPVEAEKIIKSAKSNEPLFSKIKINLVAVGRIVYVKGYDLLIESLSLVKNPSIHLTIIGEKTPENPGYCDYVLDKIKKHDLLDKVTLLGFQINPHKYIKQSDFMIISSRAEGFPNVALESNVLGVPVLAFNCPGGVSEIIEEGFNGWLVENGDIQALAQAIDRVAGLRMDSSKISLFASKKYDVARIIPSYEKVILELLK
jgi:glycosyltransferase involved in cell wall biosynthesis